MRLVRFGRLDTVDPSYKKKILQEEGGKVKRSHKDDTKNALTLLSTENIGISVVIDSLKEER